ncbi:MAG: methyltransferase [Terrimonas sp.]|nr:methyltransferase [Terrimonas sp.]
MSNPVISSLDPVGSHTLAVISGAGHFNQWVYQQFREYLKGNILEIGSGIGNISQFVIDDGHSLTLSDTNEEYCHWLEKKYAGQTAVNAILQIDLLDPEFSSVHKDYREKFDSIFLLNVIEHIEDDALAVKNCSYLLRPGGHLIMLAPAWQYLFCQLDRELGHYRRYTQKTMTALFEQQQFQVINKKYFNILGWMGWLISGKLLRHKMLRKNEMSLFDKLVVPAQLIDRLLFKITGLSVIVTGKKRID